MKNQDGLIDSAKCVFRVKGIIYIAQTREREREAAATFRETRIRSILARSRYMYFGAPEKMARGRLMRVCVCVYYNPAGGVARDI